MFEHATSPSNLVYFTSSLQQYKRTGYQTKHLNDESTAGLINLPFPIAAISQPTPLTFRLMLIAVLLLPAH